MALLLLGLTIAGVVAFVAVGRVSDKRLIARTAESERAAAERKAWEAQMKAELDAVGPLFTLPVPPLAELCADSAALQGDLFALRSFDDVADWDRSADVVIDAIDGHGAALDAALVAAQQTMAAYQAQQPWTESGFVRSERLRLGRAALRAGSAHIEQLGGLRDALLDLIALTPNDAKEQKAALRDARARRKTLERQRDRIRDEIKLVQRAADAAAEGVEEPTVLRWHHDGDTSRMEHDKAAGRRAVAEARRAIRAREDADVAQRTRSRESVELELATLERHIDWLERFDDSDP